MKQKFFGLLEDLFIGVRVKGDSGISNLLDLKSQYFNKFKKELEEKMDNLGEAVYDRLYTFFKSYFNESGSLFFANTPKWQKRYARISNKDVELFYKTRDLYYIKSQKVYENLEIEVDGVKVYFDASMLGDRVGNEKKEVEFLFSDYSEKDNKFTFLVRYKTNQKYDELKIITGENDVKKARIEILNNFDKYKNIKITENFVFKNIEKFKSKGQISDKFEMIIKSESNNTLLKELEITLTLKNYSDIKKLVDIDEEILNKAFKTYNKQIQIDYFIHKDARSFLKEQFDLWIYDYLANDIETIFNQDRLDEIRDIKKIAYELIEKIADFEDELKSIWLKPRFVLNSNYVITKDRLEKYKVLNKFLQHQGIDKQIEEWKELKLVDEDFDISKINDEKYKFLPFDTKYFKDIELDLLEKIDNLDDELDGRLIKSENFQALNTLLPKFKNQIDLIYIDPPFNLDKNADFDYLVSYKDSTWSSMLENRFYISKKLLNNEGSMFVRCDYNGNYIVRMLLNDIFGKENFRNEITIAKTKEFFKTMTNIKKFGEESESLFFFSKSNNLIFNNIYRKKDKISKYEPYLPVKDKNYTEKREINGKEYYSPKGRKWGIKQEKINEYLKDKRLIFENGKWYLLTYEEIIKDVWMDYQGYSRDWGFKTENSEVILYRVIKSASNENSLILDFFAGSGTTLSVAQKLNRKWIGVEIGEHFYTIILPRLKKVLYGYKSGISKDLEKENKLKKGGFFKYYELEQFENILKKAKYKDNLEVSPKMSYATNIDFENEKLFYAFDKLYPNIDIAETISNLIGEKIVKITKDKIILENREIDLNDLTFEKYPELKSLIYWS